VSELDPDDIASTRPTLRDNLLFLKVLTAKRWRDEEFGRDTSPVHEVPHDLVVELVEEVEQLWRDLIQRDEDYAAVVLATS
jgi:hypothetical protein